MRKWIMSLAVLSLMLPAGNICAGERLSSERAIRITYPAADTLEQKFVKITSDQKKRIRRRGEIRRVLNTFTYYEAVQSGEVQGYVVVGRAAGRRHSFPFLVAIDPDGTVRTVEILSYRGQQGGEVQQVGFLAQFRGKGATDPLRLNEDLYAVSGATISCRAVSDEVRSVLIYLLELRIVPSGE